MLFRLVGMDLIIGVGGDRIMNG